MIYFLCFLGTLSVFGGVLSGYFAIKDKMQLRLVAKLFGSVFFLFVAFVAAYYTGHNKIEYFVLVITALVFGLIGDVFLCLYAFVDKKNQILFNGLGMASFLIGHVFFISIFLARADFNWYLLPLILILPTAMLIAAKIKFIKVGKLLIPMLIYTLFLGLMAISAINIFISDKSVVGYLTLFAGLLFTASDTSLCVRNWANIDTKIRSILVYVVLSTYYVAQVLFALTIYFV